MVLDSELVLFDLDDTLCDSRLAQTRRLQYAFALAVEAAGLDDAPDYDAMVRTARALAEPEADHFPDVFDQFGIAGDRPVSIAREWILANRLHGLEYFHDAIETLRAVREARAGRRIGIITNGPAWIQRPKVELLGVAAHVDFVIISGEFGTHKPDPSIFREGLRLGSAEAEQTVFIGDNPLADVAGAHATGMTSIWIEQSDIVWPETVPQPHHIAANLGEVRRLLGA
ncbi:MAG: HAD family hydrolase [Thermomicrobiales bacterium]|nr:HAD family hydrolase [Thermomicrobiales bacterium]